MGRRKRGNEQLELEFEPKSRKVRISGAAWWVIGTVGVLLLGVIGERAVSALIAKGEPGDESEWHFQVDVKHRKAPPAKPTTMMATTPRD
jgi:hypothetical protein